MAAAKVGMVEGMLAYAKIAQADNKYKSDDTEYSIVIVVSEDEADEWNKTFQKQPATKIKASEFESKFKIPLPKEFKGERNVYTIKLKKDAVVDGVEMYPKFRPIVFLETEDGRVDITESRLIANGSRGKVSYRISDSNYGKIARLQNVLIEEEDFIEYESGKAGDEFGSKPVKKEAAKDEVTKARAPKKAKEVEPEEAEEDNQEEEVKPAKKAPAKTAKTSAKKVKEVEPEPEDDPESDDPF